MRDSYDDKIERRLQERRREAEQRKREQQKQCIYQGIAIIAGLAILIVVIVISCKGCSGNDSKNDSKLQSTTNETQESTSDKTEDESETATTNALEGKTVYTTDSLYLRKKADSDSIIIVQMPVNAELKVISVTDDGKWVRVKYVDEDGETLKGYASIDYVAEQNN
ncbi:MAG: SH3 domain-containing protein [Eubacterium sp.]